LAECSAWGREGRHRHWWAQRVTAVALVPLTLWFVLSLLMLPDSITTRFASGHPRRARVFWLPCWCGDAYHSYLGTHVIVEDYVTRLDLRSLCCCCCVSRTC